MQDLPYSEEKFSISDGGFVSRILKKLPIDNRPGSIAIVLICLTWLPLVIITAIDGTLFSGTPLPFIKDVAIQCRILIGIPMMILIGDVVFRKIPPVLNYLSEVMMLPDEKSRFISGPFKRAKKRIDSAWSEIILILIVVSVAFTHEGGTSLFVDQSEAGSWVVSKEGINNPLSFAGKWMHYISIPIFQFLLLRWLWRYLVWIILLFRVSKMKLNLQPTHPDNSGGLGIIFIAQRNFMLLFVVFGIVISSEMIESLIENDKLFEMIKVEIVGFLILSIILIVFPLFFFIRKLIKTKYSGLLELSKAGSSLSSKFEGEFVHLMGAEKKIADNTVDPSMHVDYSDVFKSLQEMSTVPMKVGDVIILALTLFVPFLPIFFIHFSIVEILQKLMGLLI